jgi:hypothetical protein
MGIRDREEAEQMGRYPVDVEPAPMLAFTVLRHRWVAERTFAWIGRYRRMSKDYEYLIESSEAMIYLTMIRLMLRRLATSPMVCQPAKTGLNRFSKGPLPVCIY